MRLRGDGQKRPGANGDELARGQRQRAFPPPPPPTAILPLTGVSMIPGATALTRMPNGPFSTAATLVSPLTACLLAVYAALFCRARKPATDAMDTMAPRRSPRRLPGWLGGAVSGAAGEAGCEVLLGSRNGVLLAHLADLGAQAEEDAVLVDAADAVPLQSISTTTHCNLPLTSSVVYSWNGWLPPTPAQLAQ